MHRVSAILCLFGPERALIGIDDIVQALDISAASAYRYAADMVEAGLLSRLAGRYRLGMKIIELEYLISTGDPIIAAAGGLMADLARGTGGDVLLCNMYDRTLVNVAHVAAGKPIPLRYSKGLPMPLFRGSQAHVVLAFMERRRLKRLYEAALQDPASRDDALRMGADWAAFSRRLRQVRKQGHYVSRGELDPGVTGIAAPVFGDGEILGSLVIVHGRAGMAEAEEAELARLAMAAARRLSDRIQGIAA
ncbi:MAG: hypothetical protein OZ927_09195 [Alcaligenaceae bacterium]|nr:hypothetical protein [Alcaligenaceae bacterium]